MTPSFFAFSLSVSPHRYHSFAAGAYLDNRPGNYVLMKKQKLNEDLGINLAREESMDWIFHFDVDELFLPGGPGADHGFFIKQKRKKNTMRRSINSES